MPPRFSSSPAHDETYLPLPLKDSPKSPSREFQKSPSDKQPIQSPEVSLHERILDDIQLKGLVARSIGRDFGERTKISKKDVERFVSLYSLSPYKFKQEVAHSVIPIMKKGSNWESAPSRRLRDQYFTKADHLMNLVSRVGASASDFASPESSRLSISEAMDEVFKSLDFQDAGAVVDKKPRKRADSRSGDSLMYEEAYINGKRAVIFALFDAFVENRTAEDSMLSSECLKMFESHSVRFREIRSHDEAKSILLEFVKKADSALVGKGIPGGCSISAGFVFDGRLTYLNIGDSRIYLGASSSGSFSKITLDDGPAGQIELGEKMDIDRFKQESHFPYLYLGGFCQKMHGRYNGSRTIYSDLRLRDSNLRTLDLNGSDRLLVMSDGVWRQFPVRVKDGKVLDASGTETISQVFADFRNKPSHAFARRLHSVAKYSMNSKTSEISDSSMVLNVPQDSSVLCVTI
ncbi:MAG: hypothetical protein ACP5NX_02730 [Candidatus Bilamarchaeaceae archaeon]